MYVPLWWWIHTIIMLISGSWPSFMFLFGCFGIFCIFFIVTFMRYNKLLHQHALRSSHSCSFVTSFSFMFCVPFTCTLCYCFQKFCLHHCLHVMFWYLQKLCSRDHPCTLCYCFQSFVCTIYITLYVFVYKNYVCTIAFLFFFQKKFNHLTHTIILHLFETCHPHHCLQLQWHFFVLFYFYVYVFLYQLFWFFYTMFVYASCVFSFSHLCFLMWSYVVTIHKEPFPLAISC